MVMTRAHHLTIMVGVAATACAPQPVPQPPTPPAPPGAAASTAAPVRAAQAHPVDLTHGLGYFAGRFYKALSANAGPNDNLFISPLSLSQGLGLALLGARGMTAEEMRTLLGWRGAVDPAPLTASYNRLLLASGDPRVEMRIANALWLAKRLPVRGEYLTAARDAYDARPESLDFAEAPGAAANRINRWVSERTGGRIPTIVSTDQFDAATAAVLTNGIYFKAEWQNDFKDGEAGMFTTGSGARKPIYLMERVAPMQYRETQEGQAAALPYGSSGRFVMEVFLPRDAATLRRWEQGLHGLTFFAGEQGSDGRFDLGAAKTQTILLQLPRFEARFNRSVNDALSQAGMPCALTGSCANFTGIAPLPMKIDRVAHATFLRVDEKGTEAAAATSVTVVVTGARVVPASIPRMIVDRPFLVTIRDRASGALIFFGRIADPTAAQALVPS